MADKIPGTTLNIFVPPELVEMGVDKALKRYFDAMIYKLRRNASKGRWEDYDLNHTFGLLEGEVIELRDAIGEGNDVEILLEAADIGNFSMIAASIAIEGQQKPGEGMGGADTAAAGSPAAETPSEAPDRGSSTMGTVASRLRTLGDDLAGRRDTVDAVREAQNKHQL